MHYNKSAISQKRQTIALKVIKPLKQAPTNIYRIGCSNCNMGEEVQSSKGFFMTAAALLALAMVASYFGDSTGQAVYKSSRTDRKLFIPDQQPQHEKSSQISDPGYENILTSQGRINPIDPNLLRCPFQGSKSCGYRMFGVYGETSKDTKFTREGAIADAVGKCNAKKDSLNEETRKCIEGFEDKCKPASLCNVRKSEGKRDDVCRPYECTEYIPILNPNGGHKQCLYIYNYNPSLSWTDPTLFAAGGGGKWSGPSCSYHKEPLNTETYYWVCKAYARDAYWDMYLRCVSR